MARTITANDLAVKAAACEPGKRASEYRIEGVDRLTLRVEASGTASFWMRYSVGNKDKRERIGKRGVNTWKEVRAKAAEINAAIEGGKDPHEVRVVAQGEVTIGQLWEKWKAANKPPKRSPKTIALYEDALRSLVWPEIGQDELAGKLTTVRMAALIRKIGERSAARAHAARTVLGTMFTFGYPDLVSHNPTRGVKWAGKVEDREQRDRVPSVHELGLVWNALNEWDFMDARTVLALKLAILTGQRNSQVAEALVAELPAGLGADVESTDIPVWTIGKLRMKKGREQTVPLTDTTTDLWLKSLSKSVAGKQVFGYSHRTLSRAMYRLVGRLGIKDLTLHDFRRGLNTWCAENGIAYDVRTRLMAHELPDVNSRVYNKAKMLEPMKGALERWEAYVLDCALKAKQAPAKIVKLKAKAVA